MVALIQNNSIYLSLFSAILTLFSLVTVIILTFKIRSISKKSKVFLSGKGGANLESLIIEHSKALEEFDKDIQELFEISNRLHNLSLKSIHKIGVVRFNPFKDIGGDQSFAIALLDGKNSGLIISSLHTREGTRVYTKPVMTGEAGKYPFTEEEKQAIRAASLVKESSKV